MVGHISQYLRRLILLSSKSLPAKVDFIRDEVIEFLMIKLLIIKHDVVPDFKFHFMGRAVSF
ncbi:hypothetical protein AAW52_04490 [Vibrio diabolicus]|nr:hypothetical protein AAW52_04490 [Vibrio diabolicus]